MLHRTRVKICGITKAEHALDAVQAGADALGLIFYSKSPRFVSIPVATRICHDIPPFVGIVGVFVDPTREEVLQHLQHLPLMLLQFHGAESRDFCESFKKPYLKVISVMDDTDVQAEMQQYPSACGFLLDTPKKREPDACSSPFDWEKIPATCDRPLILAGGLSVDNIASAIAKIRPFAVDVNSGVESSPGQKDRNKIISFMQEVQRVNNKMA